jgi:glyoxylase-like metal-dependent hydrolase (beta-lactamase superfamily II)
MNDDLDIRELVTELQPGVWRIQTPMSGHSFGTLNSYLLLHGDEALLIDTPWGEPRTIDAFRAGILATGTTPDQIHQVLVTHYHEDHSGAAGWLQSEHGAQVAMHRDDADALRMRFGDGEPFAAELCRWLDNAGVDEEGRVFAEEQYRNLSAYAYPLVPDLLVGDGDTFKLGSWAIEVIHTPGHTPGHLSFADRARGLLFTGDHVFEHRRSNATSRPIAAKRPIRSYWASTAKLLAAEPRLVLPGHEEPFTDLSGRMRHLRNVCAAKTDEVVRLSATPVTVWQVAQRVSRRTPWPALDGNGRLAAAGEAHAYLLEAEVDGRVARDGDSPALWLASTKRGGTASEKVGGSRVEPVL